MDTKEIVKVVAPCGKMCDTCANYYNSTLVQSARRMVQFLDGYEEYIAKEKGYSGIRDYQTFEKVLKEFAKGKCHGCRATDDCTVKQHPKCVIRKCAEHRDIEFCTQCSCFPCNVNDSVSENVTEDWKNKSTELSKEGVTAYYYDNIHKSQYLGYKENNNEHNTLYNGRRE